MPSTQSTSARSFWSAPFIITFAFLGATAVALPVVTRILKIALTKEPIALRSSLSKLDKSGLGPYRFLQAEVLDPAVVGTLGTDKYIQWILEDTSITEKRSPLRYASLFISYYTGQPDAVPHVPEECMKGAGYQRIDNDDVAVTVELPGGVEEIPLRFQTFARSAIFDADKMPVLYTFHCNGKFMASRHEVRMAASDPFDKHSYFSKVEISFGWPQAQPRYPSKDQAIDSTQKLLTHLLPLLLENHWPDWAAVKAAERNEGSEDANSEIASALLP